MAMQAPMLSVKTDGSRFKSGGKIQSKQLIEDTDQVKSRVVVTRTKRKRTKKRNKTYNVEALADFANFTDASGFQFDDYDSDSGSMESESEGENGRQLQTEIYQDVPSSVPYHVARQAPKPRE